MSSCDLCIHGKLEKTKENNCAISKNVAICRITVRVGRGGNVKIDRGQ